MKRLWKLEELMEHFTLLPDERALLANKSGSNRLGFAVLLKFFQMEARFPLSKQEVAKPVVTFIAKQVEVAAKQYREYEWLGSTFVYHRAQVRAFFGFREATVQDAQDLTEWLGQKLKSFDQQETHLQEAVYQRLRSLKIEPPTKERLERIIRSAVRTSEEEFCSNTAKQLLKETLAKIGALLVTEETLDSEQVQLKQSNFNNLKTDPGRISLDSILKEFDKLKCIWNLELPSDLFTNIPYKVLQHYRQRASAEPPRELRRHPDSIRYTLVASFCWLRSQEITDSLVELLVGVVHRIGINAERRVDKELINDFKRVNGKPNLLFRIAEASLEQPEGKVEDVIYRAVSKKTLQDVVKEHKSNGPLYQEKVYTVMRTSYLHHYRRMVPQLLSMLEFRSNNDVYRPLISALDILKKYQGSTQHYYAAEE